MTAGGNSFKNATAHKVNSYYTLAISYCTFCVGKHTILGPAFSAKAAECLTRAYVVYTVFLCTITMPRYEMKRKCSKTMNECRF